VSWYAAKFILTPIAIDPYNTNPDGNGSEYKKNLSAWTNCLKDSGFAVTIDSSEISVYNLLTIPIELNEGWNILSVPVVTGDMTTTTLFPTAISPFYEFNNTYNQISVLENGKGYWAMFNGNQSVTITGTLRNGNDILVNQGWNLIGPFAHDISVNNITSSPPNIIISEFYGYFGAYITHDTLESGKGYWVKTSVNGVLQLNNNLR
jgi:hypothetical protein